MIRSLQRMKQQIRNLLPLSGYYISNLLQGLISFFYTPLLIKSLGLREFGRWSLLEPILLVLPITALLGVNYGIIKQINVDDRSPKITTIQLFLTSHPAFFIINAIGILILLWSGYKWKDAAWFSLTVYLEALLLILLSAYRASTSVAAFSASTLVKACAVLGILYLTQRTGWQRVQRSEAMIMCRLLAVAFSIGFGLVFVKRSVTRDTFIQRYHTESAWGVYKDALLYGFPLLLTSLITMVIEFIDRYILSIYMDNQILASYIVYLKVASMLKALLVTPLAIWWPTERFKRLRSNDGGRSYFKAITIVVLAVLLVAGGSLWLVSEWLIRWFAPEVPIDRTTVLLLIFSGVAVGLSYPMNIGTLIKGYTHWNVIGVLAAAGISILLNFLLVPYAGLRGAAYANLVSYICYMFFLNLISQRIHPVPFPYAKIILIVGIALVIMVGVDRYNAPLSFILKVLLYCCFFSLFSSPLIIPVLRHSRDR